MTFREDNVDMTTKTTKIALAVMAATILAVGAIVGPMQYAMAGGLKIHFPKTGGYY
jgi:hypothetical protein